MCNEHNTIRLKFVVTNMLIRYIKIKKARILMLAVVVAKKSK